MGCYHVIGGPGSGKTSWTVHKVLEEDLTYINAGYRYASKYIRDFNKRNKTSLTLPPERHVVSSNIDIHRKLPTMSSYPINGFEFGAPNKFQATKRLIPFGTYVFDEAQQYWDSKGVQHLPPWVNRIFELRRHIHLNIYLITQKLTRLHSDIRSTVDSFILINKSVHTYLINGKKIKSKIYLDHGELIKTEFYGVEFCEESQVERYLDGDHSVGKRFKDVHKGDIRNNYNPYEYSVELEDYDRDFNYVDYNEPATQCSIPQSWLDYKKSISSKKKQKEEE